MSLSCTSWLTDSSKTKSGIGAGISEQTWTATSPTDGNVEQCFSQKLQP